ncbi:papain family cysteine protease domain-containing protein [Ditylenchus destructor]|uniref:Histone acetyltransferase type B catalytic subunit n=1 Tax=Ditylenchus destructor TaxID=166010 RepID=A0AAD4R0S3_9BILA|nr:papain family cysteine protease domain-containing protein [Ditylenchus destructor]
MTTLGLIFTPLFLFCFAELYAGDIQFPQGISKLNDDEKRTQAKKQVEEINKKTNGRWRAEFNERFALLELEHKKRMAGTISRKSRGETTSTSSTLSVKSQEPNGPFGMPNFIKETNNTQTRRRRQTLPSSFDSRTKWPQCAPFMNNIRDQSNCGDCWAVSSGSVLTDRRCIARAKQGDGSRRAEMYRAERIHKKVLNTSDKSANHQLQVYLAKSQSMAFWFIGQLAYMNDELINSQGQPSFHYFLYEVKEQSPRYTFLGYASLYVPEKYFNSARIGHLMLSPPYTHSGIGSKFLDAIYGDLLKDDKVEYITIEKPAEQLKLVRNFTDCRNLLKMPEFSRSEVLDTDVITQDMKAAAMKIKLEKNQYEKAFQIIRLYYLSGDQENFHGNLSDKDRSMWKRHSWVVKRLQKFVGMPHWSPIREPPPMVFEEDQDWSLPDELPECYVRRTLYEDMKPRAENEPTQGDQVVPIELRMCSRQLTPHIAHFFSKLRRLHVRKQKIDQITESIQKKVEAKIPATRRRYPLRSMTPSPYVFTRGLNNT